MADTSPEAAPRRLLLVVVATLVVLWVVLTGLRAWMDGKESAALGDHRWEVRVSVRLENAVPGIPASVAIPVGTDHLRVIGQQSSHSGWRQRFVSAESEKGTRRVRLTSEAAGRQGFEVSFGIHQYAAPLLTRPEPPRPLGVDLRETYLSSGPLLGLGHEVITNEVELLTAGSESMEEVLRRIALRAHHLLPMAEAPPRAVPEVLASGRAGVLERAYVMVALCRAAYIPARLVTGLILQENPQATPHHWVEVYDDEQGWLAYDPLYGYRQGVPENYLPFVRDQADIARVDADQVMIAYAVTDLTAMLNMRVGEDKDWHSLFYLTRLPLEVRDALAILLLMPLAVTLSMAFREVTGVVSYGVFTPTLFAIVLTRSPWQSAAMMLGLVLLFGVLGRLAMPGQLKRSPRLTLVITLVAMGTVASISLLEYFALNPEGAVVLLSIVILSTMVDRIYKTLDTEGLESVIARLGWTLVQTVFLCLPVMQYKALGHLLVLRPESHLLTLAAILLVINYHGKPLAERASFRWMKWPADQRKKSARERHGNSGG